MAAVYYPGTLTLLPGGVRQLKVHRLDPDNGTRVDIHTATRIEFAGSPEHLES